MGSHGIPAVSHMSGCPTFDTDPKKIKQKRAEFKLRYPTGRWSNDYPISINSIAIAWIKIILALA